MARKRRDGQSGQHQNPGSQRQDPAASDHLWDALVANWQHILRMYRLCEDRRPIIVLYDIQEQRVYIYPYLEFKAEMSPASQLSLEEMHERATREGKFIAFIRDNEQRRLVSFSVDPEWNGEAG